MSAIATNPALKQQIIQFAKQSGMYKPNYTASDFAKWKQAFNSNRAITTASPEKMVDMVVVGNTAIRKTTLYTVMAVTLAGMVGSWFLMRKKKR